MCKLCSLKDDEIMSKQELEEAKKKISKLRAKFKTSFGLQHQRLAFKNKFTAA